MILSDLHIYDITESYLWFAIGWLNWKGKAENQPTFKKHLYMKT